MVQLLLDEGAPAEINALHKAIEHGHNGVVKLLVQNGAHTSETNRNYETALDLAIRPGRESTLRVLLEMGADVDS